jgi:hypothetical protein
MPAKSQAQRGFIAHKFGVGWMKRHHFANKGKLPARKHKHMNDPSRLIRLAEIDKNLESIIKFDYGDDEDERKKSSTLLPLAAGAGLGAGGLLAHQAIRGSGGYAKNLLGARAGYGMARSGLGTAATAGSSLGY